MYALKRLIWWEGSSKKQNVIQRLLQSVKLEKIRRGERVEGNGLKVCIRSKIKRTSRWIECEIGERERS
jgi:hypothetical protein